MTRGISKALAWGGLILALAASGAQAGTGGLPSDGAKGANPAQVRLAEQNAKGNKADKQQAPISTTRSNIKHAAPIQSTRSNIKHAAPTDQAKSGK